MAGMSINGKNTQMFSKTKKVDVESWCIAWGPEDYQIDLNDSTLTFDLLMASSNLFSYTFVSGC